MEEPGDGSRGQRKAGTNIRSVLGERISEKRKLRSPGDVLVITSMHEPLPIPVRRKCTDPTSLCSTTVALLLPVHPTQGKHVCARRNGQVARSNGSDASIRSPQYLTRVWACQANSNTYFKLIIKRKRGMVCMENGIKMETCAAMLRLNSV